MHFAAVLVLAAVELVGKGGGGEEKKIELQVSSLERNLKKFHEVYEISVQGKKRG